MAEARQDNEFIIQDNTLYKYTGSSHTVTVPDGILYIKQDAFFECKTLLKVIFPDGLKEIGDNAFAHCCNLREISFPGTLQKIGAGAFCCCKELKEIRLPSSVKELGAYGDYGVFDGCTGLKEVVLSPKIKHIYAYTFKDCVNLKSISSRKHIKIYPDAFLGSGLTANYR
ncbi:MAG: leucine-rich repeat domain-containing protein [Lachnospiraceae bacterium]|nr:leucine-rich repeat domain-containing protein [Lachnospiraceae bacterium]